MVQNKMQIVKMQQLQGNRSEPECIFSGILFREWKAESEIAR